MNARLPKNFHWVSNQCDDAVKEAMQAYWTEKWPRIEKLLVNFPLAVQDIRVTMAGHRPAGLKPWYDFRAVLKLPIGTLVADASGKEPAALLDYAVDTLVGEIKRRKERGSKSFVIKRKDRSHADLSAGGLQSQRGLEARQEFFSVIRPLLPLLRAHARHELRTLEARGLVHRGELTVADLLDETLTVAWQKYEQRPRGVSLETWFTELLHGVVEEWVRQEPHPYRSVDDIVREELPSDEEPQVDDQEWWAWLLGYRDRSTVADLLPDRESASVASADGAPIDTAESLELPAPMEIADERHRISSLLGELPIVERQTLILYALDGLAPYEIAMIQDRPESEVASDIEAARRTLSERFLAGDSAAGGVQAPQATRVAAPGASTANPVAAAGRNQ